MFAAESSAFAQTRHSHPPANDTVNFHTAATPTAWDDAAAASFAVTNPVLSLGHFRRALLGYSWRAPKVPLATTGMLASMTIESPTDGDVFLAFVEQVLAPRLEPGHVVILDNLSAHKVAGVRQLIEERGAQLLYPPPYSPNFNPIEQAWSKLKQRLRGVKARVLGQLEPAITDALPAITAHNARVFFRHCGYGIQ